MSDGVVRRVYKSGLWGDFMGNDLNRFKNIDSPLALACSYCSPTDIALVGFCYGDIQEIDKRLHFETKRPVRCYGFDGASSLVLVANNDFFADIYVFSQDMGQSEVSKLSEMIRNKHINDGLACKDPVFIGHKPLDVHKVCSPSRVVSSLLSYLIPFSEEK